VTDIKSKTRRQLVEDARRTALDGDWELAITLNQNLLERTPRDAEAQNRLGRAYFQLNNYSAAYEAYSGSLKIDPANMIARRNLQRLELLRRKHGADVLEQNDSAIPIIPKTNVFIEEVGKTWVDELVNPVSLEELAEVSAGEQLTLAVEGHRLYVERLTGERLGEVDAKTAERLVELILSGNRYEVYALGLSSSSLRVILRESYRDPKLANKFSFPRQITYTRAYLRDRDQLRQRDEADFLFSDDDDEDIDDDESGTLTPDEDVSNNSDNDAFEEDVVVVEEEEQTL
jgi:tetratricopeptide (TPR) repeat protein